MDTPEGIAAAAEGGADRIELCSALALGGLTPSPGLMHLAAKASLPGHAMIRPVAGGFDADDTLLGIMLTDIAAARAAGLSGVVIGATANGRLDIPRMTRLIEAAQGMEITLHRAIDLCADPVASVDDAAELGITRILTSGGATDAPSGADTIAQMVERADGKLTIMAGSGVTADNARSLVKTTGVTAVHASCATSAPERDEIAHFGFGPPQRRVTDVAKIRALRSALDAL